MTLGFQSLGFQSLGFQSLGFQSLGFQSLGFQSLSHEMCKIVVGFSHLGFVHEKLYEIVIEIGLLGFRHKGFSHSVMKGASNCVRI